MEGNNKDNKDNNMEEMPATGGMVFTGPYGELCRFFEQVERDAPRSVRLVYRRFSPGRLLLKAEGER